MIYVIGLIIIILALAAWKFNLFGEVKECTCDKCDELNCKCEENKCVDGNCKCHSAKVEASDFHMNGNGKAAAGSEFGDFFAAPATEDAFIEIVEPTVEEPKIEAPKDEPKKDDEEEPKKKEEPKPKVPKKKAPGKPAPKKKKKK